MRHTELRSLDALEGVTEVLGVFLGDNPQLDDLSALDGVTSEFGLEVVRTRAAGTLEMPPAARGLHLADAETTALSSQREEVVLTILDCTELESLSFPEVRVLHELNLRGLSKLTGLAEAFPQIEEIGSLVIEDCPGISTQEFEELAAHVTSGNAASICGGASGSSC